MAGFKFFSHFPQLRSPVCESLKHMSIGLSLLILRLVDLLIDLRYIVLDVPNLHFDSFTLIRWQLLMGDLILQILKRKPNCQILLKSLHCLVLFLSDFRLDLAKRSIDLLHFLFGPKQQFSFLVCLFFHNRYFFLGHMQVPNGHPFGFHRIG